MRNDLLFSRNFTPPLPAGVYTLPTAWTPEPENYICYNPNSGYLNWYFLTYADFQAQVSPNRWTNFENLNFSITDANRDIWPFLWFYDGFGYDVVANPFDIMVQNLTITDNDNPENVQVFPNTTYHAVDVVNSLSQGRGVLCLLPLNTPITYPLSCTVTGTITAVQTASPVS